MSKEPNYTTYMGKDMSLLIIISLLYHDGSHSGYSLLKRVKEITEGKFKFRVGRIYDQVDELLNQGFLTQEIHQITEKKVKAVYSPGAIEYSEKCFLNTFIRTSVNISFENP